MIQWLTALVVTLTALAVGRLLLMVGKLDDLIGALVQNLLILPRLVGALLAVAGLYGGGAGGGSRSSAPDIGGLVLGGLWWLLALVALVVVVWRGPTWVSALRLRRNRSPRPARVAAEPAPKPESARPAEDFEMVMRRAGRR
jgi:hypothetical protein